MKALFASLLVGLCCASLAQRPPTPGRWRAPRTRALSPKLKDLAASRSLPMARVSATVSQPLVVVVANPLTLRAAANPNGTYTVFVRGTQPGRVYQLVSESVLQDLATLNVNPNFSGDADVKVVNSSPVRFWAVRDLGAGSYP